MTLALPLIATSLRWFGYVKTHHRLARWSPCAGSRTATPEELQSAERLALLASIAGRHGVITATCLRQSLLLFWWLRRRGLNPVIRIGVCKQDTALDAHAWVELDGSALAQGDRTHQPFDLPEQTA